MSIVDIVELMIVLDVDGVRLLFVVCARRQIVRGCGQQQLCKSRLDCNCAAAVVVVVLKRV